MKKGVQILNSTVFKITSLNSISVIFKMAIGFFTTRIIAQFAGTSGMAFLGNLRNFMTLLESISTFGTNDGVIKTIAQHKNHLEKVSEIVSTIFFAFLLVSVLLSGFLFFNANWFNAYLFGAQFQYQLVIKCLALAVPFYVLSILFVAIINGFGNFKKVIFINISGNVIGFLLTFLLVFKYQITGALLSTVLTPALLLIVSTYYVQKTIPLISFLSVKKIKFSVVKDLSGYTLMALFSSVVGSFVMIGIRNYLITQTSIHDAGLWEAVTRVSSNYLMFATTLISMYYLPKLAVAKSNLDTKLIVFEFFKSLVPMFIVGVLGIYFLRNIIIQILFTNDFAHAESLFMGQIIGDLFKVCAMILAYQMVAKKMILTFILTECFSLGIFAFASYFLINSIGVEGIVLAYAISNGLYFLALLFVFRKIFIKQQVVNKLQD